MPPTRTTLVNAYGAEGVLVSRVGQGIPRLGEQALCRSGDIHSACQMTESKCGVCLQ